LTSTKICGTAARNVVFTPVSSGRLRHASRKLLQVLIQKLDRAPAAILEPEENPPD
jgi:hypothetical protein